jgi:hypothetical protein
LLNSFLRCKNSTKIMKAIKCTIPVVLAVAMGLATVINANAGENSSVNPFLGALSVVAPAELPGKAGELVAQADAKNLRQTTIDVVKAAVGLNPAAATAVVGSIAQSSPKMAGLAAAMAISLVPNQVVSIARAAAAAAPKQAGAIVEAICRVLPEDYQKVADAVSEIVPGAGKEILAGISVAIPQLNDLINHVLASYNGNIPSVSAVLSQVADVASSSGTVTLASDTPSLPRGPSVGPPTIPISGTPPSPIDPGSGGAVPMSPSSPPP